MWRRILLRIVSALRPVRSRRCPILGQVKLFLFYLFMRSWILPIIYIKDKTPVGQYPPPPPTTNFHLEILFRDNGDKEIVLERCHKILILTFLFNPLFPNIRTTSDVSTNFTAMSNTNVSSESLPAGMRDPARRVLTHPIIKDRAIIEKYGAETNGEFTQIRVTVAPGGGTPLHYHGSYEEHLTSIRGILSCVVGKRTLTFSPGETAVIPIGTEHRFFNASDEDVDFIGKVVPAHEGFEKSLHICYGLAEDGECDDKGLPRSFLHLCLMAELGDMKWPGVMLIAGLGNTLVKAVAAYARWSGEEERLLGKYYY